jgi:ubiquinone/menaquinone biosynthesis C-methylase UbiE
MGKQTVRNLLLRAYHLVVPPRMDREIHRAISIRQQDFPSSVVLPKEYGRRMNERVIELLIAKLTYRPGAKVLDVGHANIMTAHARMLKSLPRPIDITGLDIAPASESIRALYTNSVVGNITETEFNDESFDLIWCISALEHFGMDNSVYTDQFTLDMEMDMNALKEMTRIVRKGGTIYVSVPYGKFENHGWLKNYDRIRWQKLLDVARPSSRIDELYFKYSDEHGWSTSGPEELSNTGYLDHRNTGASGLAVALVHRLG